MDKPDKDIYLSAIMWQACSTQGSDICRGGGLCLQSVWHVRADPSYDIRRGPHEYRGLVAIRTLAGTGRVALDSLGTVDLDRNTLFIAENQKIQRYFCAARNWHFWWFEFSMAGPIFFVLHSRVQCPASRYENTTLAEIFRNLRQPSSAQRSFASTGLAYLIHRWMAVHHEQRPMPPHKAAIERVIDAMHERTDGSWSVADMARNAGLSERRFRQVFLKIAGSTPKRFYDGVRLELGRRIIIAEAAKISDVADRLGFSSPFHFSRAFRARYGKPPSALLLA